MKITNSAKSIICRYQRSLKREDYAIDSALLVDMARATMQLNITKESFRLDPTINKKFNALLS